MTYRDRQRLADIQAAIEAIRSHLQRGDLSDGLVFDAVRIRLLEIGEAVKALPMELLDTQPGIPWRQIARMHAARGHLHEPRRRPAGRRRGIRRGRPPGHGRRRARPSGPRGLPREGRRACRNSRLG